MDVIHGGAATASIPDQARKTDATQPQRQASVHWALLAGMAVTAVATCLWRASLAHPLLPGIFTVVSVPLSVVCFVVLDRRVRFELGQWSAATLIVSAHMLLSVPGPGGPIYYRGSDVIRVDHVMHLLAGGVVAWLSWHVATRLRPAHVSPATTARFVVLTTMGLGVVKEITDFASVSLARAPHDITDSYWDLAMNAIGALAALAWIRATTSRTPTRVR